MSQTDLEANKALASRFIDCLNRHDLAGIEALLHPDFVWATAVVGDNDPNAFRPMQSKTLQGKSLPHAKPRLNREESLNVPRAIFGGRYSDSMQNVEGDASSPSAESTVEGNPIRIDILTLTAEDDRVAMEAESDFRNDATGRRYNNFYHHLFRIRDGKVVLFKEYQDTLHLFDYASE